MEPHEPAAHEKVIVEDGFAVPEDIMEKYVGFVSRLLLGIDNGVTEKIKRFLIDKGWYMIYTYQDFLKIKPEVEQIQRIGQYRLA